MSHYPIHIQHVSNISYARNPQASLSTHLTMQSQRAKSVLPFPPVWLSCELLSTAITIDCESEAEN